jgi:hypothetical protein
VKNLIDSAIPKDLGRHKSENVTISDAQIQRILDEKLKYAAQPPIDRADEIVQRVRQDVLLKEGYMDRKQVEEMIKKHNLPPPESAQVKKRINLASRLLGTRIYLPDTSPTYRNSSNFLLNWLGLGTSSQRPSTVLTAGVLPGQDYALNPGDCWCFAGHEGNLTLALGQPAYLKEFTLYHMSGDIVDIDRSSAPQNIEIYSLSSLSPSSSQRRTKALIGSMEYKLDGPAMQSIPLHNTPSLAKYVQVRIRSNHGHPCFTCIYRLGFFGACSNTPLTIPQ